MPPLRHASRAASRPAARPAARPRRHRAVPRAGMALPTVLALVVVASLLTAGALTAARQTFRGGRNALVEQRAFSVAEFGLNQRIAAWNTQLNLPGGAGGLDVGGVDSTSVYVATGDTARVRITRLDDVLYWVESVGRASIGRPTLQSVRNVSSVVRIAYPTITPRGAVTAGGDIDVNGAATIDGRDALPFMAHKDSDPWAAAQCASLRGADVPAIAAPPGADVSYKKGSLIAPVPVVYDPAAADSNTYVRYGTESWRSLTSNADVRLAGGQYGSDLVPALRITPPRVPGAPPDTVCDRSVPLNWGEPFRGTGRLRHCQGYFPIIYVDGDLQLNGKGRGQGILLVNGDLRINGTFDFAGLIVVRDDINKGNGSATITGAVMARNVSLSDGSYWAGRQSVTYSKCAVESALRGSAILVRVRERSWAQLY